MQTSYFQKSGKNENCVSIARSTPEWLPGVKEYPSLAPSNDLLWSYKHGNITAEEYIKRYHSEVLDKLDAATVFKDLGEEAILCCWEKNAGICHRTLIAKWLERELGIIIDELE
jgi:uncharacterized protein YeaO (DUF488 family)